MRLAAGKFSHFPAAETGIARCGGRRWMNVTGTQLPLMLLLLLMMMLIATEGTDVADVDKQEDEYMTSCRHDLGMNSGAIPDSAINASSAYDMKSVGPHNSRIRTEKNGGAWCPRNQVGRESTEWLQIDLGELKVISVVETQGRFGNGQGQEFAPSYLLEYQREDGARWLRFRDRKGAEVLQGNRNPYLAEMRELHPPIIARRIRFVPFSTHPRTVCMRVELYGCTWTDGLVSYDMRQGDRRGTEMDFYDFTYDGTVTDNFLAGGLGQLTDFEVGDYNFRLDLQNLGRKGYEWVGWRNDTSMVRSAPGVEIVFRFDQVRNFSAVLITSNNMFSREVSVFRSAQMYFSVGGVHYQRPPITYEYVRDTTLELAREVIIPINPGRVGQFVRLVLQFELRWMMISEIRFQSEKVNETFPVEEEPVGDYIDLPVDGSNMDGNKRSAAGNEEEEQTEEMLQTDFPDVVQVGSHRVLNDTYIGIIIGALAVFIILMAVIGTLVMLRLRRKKYGCGGSGSGTPSKFVFASADRMSLHLVDQTQTQPVGGKLANGNVPSADGLLMANSTFCETNNWLNEREMSLKDRKTHRPVNSLRSSGNRGRPDSKVLDLNVYASLARQPSPVVPLTSTNLGTSCRPNGFVPPLPPHPSQSMDSLSCSAEASTPDVDVGLDGSALSPPWGNFADLEFPRETLKLIETLAKGEFGDVLLCNAVIPGYLVGTSGRRSAKKPRPVVVKTLDPRAPKKAQLNLYNETEVLIGLQDPNIVQVLGVCTRDEPIAVIVEYSELGDLNQFLKNAVADQPATVTADISSQVHVLSYGCLIYMATQIASGMKYLETLNMVHRDLATRNCLVGHKYSIKISDYGMNRKLYNTDYYRTPQGIKLPVRWMAWEAVLLHQFTCKTDVWSFAVTLWEILTFARERPFAALTDEQILENCARCYSDEPLDVVLNQPANCPREIYDLMVECWNRVDIQRPTFREIHMFLQRKNMGYSPTTEWPRDLDIGWLSGIPT